MCNDDEEQDFEENEAPGWDAIDRALSAVYGDIEPMHWGTVIPYWAGGGDPLTGVSAYQSTKQRPHLHYVTYGFSELYEKDGDDPDWSGYGFELTFRLASTLKEEPPIWVASLLQNLARYVFETGRGFGVGHTMPLNSPICKDIDTKIRTVCFVRDPELGIIDTPNGQVEFLQVFGMTEDELDATQCWNADRFTQLIAKKNELLITDLFRESTLKNAEFAAQVAKLTSEEGASAGIMTADQFRVIGHPRAGEFSVYIGALLAPGLGLRLRGRIPFGREFSICGDQGELRFVPGSQFTVFVDDEVTTISLNTEQMNSLTEVMHPQAGTYQFENLPGLTLIIEPTEITDNDGNVTETLG